MKSKLTLSISNKADTRSNILTRQDNSGVVKLFKDYIELMSEIDHKLHSKKRITGIIDAHMAADESDQYFKEIHKKHRWQ